MIPQGAPDDIVLGHLAEPGELGALERHPEEARHGLHRGDLERGRGAHALALGHARVDQDPQPAIELEPAFPCQHDQDPDDVGRPVMGRIAPNQCRACS